jgi:hypothetical protein
MVLPEIRRRRSAWPRWLAAASIAAACGDEVSHPPATGGTSTSSAAGPSSTSGDSTSVMASSDDDGVVDADDPGCPGGLGLGICGMDSGTTHLECDLFAQDCPTGEKCMPWARDEDDAWNATRCSPVAADPVPVGGSCTAEDSGLSGVDDCDIGLMCWNLDEHGVGHCEDFCTGSDESPLCESPSDVCLFTNDGAIALCLSGCDPTLQDCAPDEGCWPEGDAWVCLPDFSQFGSMPGDPCLWSSDCAPGLVCLAADALPTCVGEDGCCTAVCDATADDADAPCSAIDPAATCRPWYADGQAPWGLDHVGVCITDDDPDPTTGG